MYLCALLNFQRPDAGTCIRFKLVVTKIRKLYAATCKPGSYTVAVAVYEWGEFMNPASSKTVIYAAAAGNLLVALIKFATAGFTGSAAMFSEAIHSVVDTGNQLLLLYGLKCAARPPSPSHPFGYGLQLYFWTFVVAIMIFGLGAGVSVVEGIDKIRAPHPIENAFASYIVLGVAIMLEGAVWVIALLAFREVKGSLGWIEAIKQSKDPTLFTVLFEDTAALLGLIVALIGTYLSQALEMPLLDGVASVVIGVILALTAVFLAKESHSLLTGEAVSPAVRESIYQIAIGEPGVDRANEVLTMHFGPKDVLVALSLDFENRRTAHEVEEAVTRIERRIKQAHPEVTRVFVEAQSLEAHRRGLESAA